ncbi:tetratricopeptide repeat protein [Paracoccaceae bacterium]|nr:tetratricopeptide repeat protein [Paracoccaceae bacterium]
MHMGLVLHKSRELNAAIKSYQKVVSIKPDFFEAYNNMGNVFEDNDDLDLAIEAYKKALNI